jgi:hypothetical protein
MSGNSEVIDPRDYVHWHGAALFRFEDDRIGELWVLGDLAGLNAMLRSNASETPKL